MTTSFDPKKLAKGVQAHFDRVEAAYDDITPGVAKQVIWAGAPEQKTAWSVLYVHGFTATSQEIRPVPDEVAKAIGANLVLTRLQGHGRGTGGLIEGTVAGWMADVAEGLAAARAVGDRVLVIGTSMGGTLVAGAAVDAGLMEDVHGIVMISPNFALSARVSFLARWPAARYWLPLIVGKDWSFPAKSEAHGRYWTISYPSVATLPMAALVNEVAGLDFSLAQMPALFWFSDADKVVRAALTRDVAGKWGGAVTIHNPVLGPDDDPNAHVIAGAIRSPAQNDAVIRGILKWFEGL